MIKIIKPGMLTTVQDLGRSGYQKYGVVQSGAMDAFAHRIANLLAGNPENEATLEITLTGPVLEFQNDTLIAICGSGFHAVLDGKPVGLWRPKKVKSGSELRLRQDGIGCRVYLAVSGGISVPEVLKSKSTYLRAKIGGFNGRALQAGDVLETGIPGKVSRQLTASLEYHSAWSVSKNMLPDYGSSPTIRVVPGRNEDLFTAESIGTFFREPYRLSQNSDRMGYRLEGPKLAVKATQEMLSESVSFGTIQVPSGGEPIVLLADRQTTGGYPKIAQVASVDLPLLAQLKPGDELRFKKITLQEAQLLYIEREKQIRMLKGTIAYQAKRRGTHAEH
ncbi:MULTISPECIES: biotin-dependent carboxyltransferase family protein [Heyndrickxia]|uniref:5-oxoprolinase subunit C family protein n=1 Tax=Heyndrickxia TaxID=2837504 RepID=UPI002DB65E67|nr:biotin-dependent carboxyltransferase family protein [Weizmannia sp. CD-2023]MEC2224368.1 biotin-dependent carboxyltransferase family protein [Weizmannia sp. CD-2023]